MFVCLNIASRSTEEIYSEFRDERMVGYFAFGRPILLVIDLELAKAILVKDFDHFADRRHFDISQVSGQCYDITISEVLTGHLTILIVNGDGKRC